MAEVASPESSWWWASEEGGEHGDLASLLPASRASVTNFVTPELRRRRKMRRGAPHARSCSGERQRRVRWAGVAPLGNPRRDVGRSGAAGVACGAALSAAGVAAMPRRRPLPRHADAPAPGTLASARQGPSEDRASRSSSTAAGQFEPLPPARRAVSAAGRPRQGARQPSAADAALPSPPPSQPPPEPLRGGSPRGKQPARDLDRDSVRVQSDKLKTNDYQHERSGAERERAEDFAE